MKCIVRSALLVAVVGAALMAGPGSARAHERDWRWREIDQRGVYIGFGGMANFVVNQASAPVDGFISQGGGLNLFLGVRLARMFALEAGYALNVHNPVHDAWGATTSALLLHAATLDMKFIIPNPSPVRPFFQAGLGIYELAGYPDNTDYRNGLGFQLGGGLDVYLNHVVSIGGRALYHGISFTQDIGPNKPFLSTVSVEGNLQFHF